MSTSITNLPPEMIEQIFGHLQPRERLVVSGTCKSWHKLAFSPKFCKRLYLHLRSTDDIVCKIRAGTISELCRNAVISCDGISDDHKTPLIEYLLNAPLESLKIVTAKETAISILNPHLAQMAMLETLHLDLRDCDGEVLRITHPTLKTAIFDRMGTFEIDCPNLSALKSYLPDEKSADSIKSLRGQLQSLSVSSGVGRVCAALSDVEWSDLTELDIAIVPARYDLEKLLARMPCLKKLALRDQYTFPSVGKEFGVAKSLSELVLDKMKINEEFNKSLRRLPLLENLTLIDVISTALGEDRRFKSSNIKRLTFVHRHPNLLPDFPNLKFMELQCAEDGLSELLEELCIYYPKLEHLSFGVAPGQLGMFQTQYEYPETKSFGHLEKLKFLRTLQLNRLAMGTLDWTSYSEVRIERLRLDGCSIDGWAAQQMVQIFNQLRQLFFDHCYLRQPSADVFDLDENFTPGLRSQLPRCAISYYDCHIEEMNEVCGGRRDVI